MGSPGSGKGRKAEFYEKPLLLFRALFTTFPFLELLAALFQYAFLT